MKRNELLVKTKAKRLLIDVVYPVVENFPRSETHALSLHVKHGDCYWLISHIFDPYLEVK